MEMKGTKLVTGLVAGALVGAAAGLLLAPKSGKETRKMVGKRAGKYVGNVREKFSKGRGSEIIEEHSSNGFETIDSSRK